MLYNRFTKRCNGILHVFDINDHEIALSELKALDIVMIVGRLAFLEDKIESGEIVDRNDYLDHLMSTKTVLELTNKEIDFFVTHDTKIRKYVDEEITRLISENQRMKKQLDEIKGVVNDKIL